MRLAAPALNIRSKIILPYLILTLIVAAVGTYVVTSLVAGSLDERLTNHLLEAGRVVSDSLARQEISHLESARIVAYTQGLADALREGDAETVASLARPVAVGLGLECLIVVDANGLEVLHLWRQADGSYAVAEGGQETGLWMVQALLDDGDPAAVPLRALGLHPAVGGYYYLSAIPIGLEDETVGVVVAGTSLDTLLPHFKATSLADVTIYVDDGQAVASTFTVPGQQADAAALLEELSLSPGFYEQCLTDPRLTLGENIEIRERWYRLAHGPLQVGSNTLGEFSVALPLHFILRAGATSRNTYALLFAAAMAGVILIGYLIAQRITQPLARLVRTSQAVAQGDLEQRTGITTSDEIGRLAATFDQMTARLAERTVALQELLHTHKEAAGRMRAILSSIGDGVLLEGGDGSFVPLNAAAEVLLDEMATSFLLGPLRELSAGESRPKDDFAPGPWLLESRRFQVGDKMFNAHSAAVRTDDGERLGNVIVLRDVTAEAEAEQLKDAFVAHASHELRTPLTSIKGYSALLLSATASTLSAEQRSFLEAIGRQTDSLMMMIDALLDFSEMEASGQLGLQRRPVQLNSLVAEVAEEWRPHMEEKGIAFQAEIPDQVPAVEGDARRLRWAVVNLVRNAWQYTPAGGQVTLRLRPTNGRVVLDVADTGVGISAREAQRLFTRFHRASSRPGTTDEARGLGLGLYVTKAIVEAHGGEVRVVSRVGSGSTFSLVLPAS